MKRFYALTMMCLLTTFAFANSEEKINYTEDFVLGTPDIQSINAITFGPEGILFLGDSKMANIVAIETNDNQQKEGAAIGIKKIDQKIADLLGLDKEQVSIKDMAVNPISKNIYLAIHTADGTPVILKIKDENTIESVSLKEIKYSTVSLNNAIAEDAKDRRGRSQRVWAVSDLSFFDGKVMVSGLSNKEFSSTFRSINFPFKKKQVQTSLEIYHAAHGRYETYAPIKTFAAAKVNGKNQLIASYTCTPLVLFSIDELKEDTHVKGRTVAELGNWNTPLDMIVMEKDNDSYLLLANSSRALMKIKFSDLEGYSESLVEPVTERSGIAGVDFINLPFVNVQQLDKIGNELFVVIQRKGNGDLDLLTQSNRWL